MHRRPLIALLLWLGGTLSAGAAPARITLSVPGIACKACAGDIEGQLTRLAGVTAVTVDIGHKHVVVAFDDGQVQPAEMLRRLDDMGFRGRVLPPPKARRAPPIPSATANRR